MTGQEERDVLFARLFGITAIVQSGLLVRNKPLPTSPSSATLASSLSGYQKVVLELWTLGEKKSWLRESAWWTLCLAVDVLRGSGVSWKEDALKYTINLVFIEDKSWSPEKIAITLKLKTLLPNEDWRTLLSPTFKNPDPCHNTNLKALASILKVISIDSLPIQKLMYLVQDVHTDHEASKNSVGHYKPQLHFAWDVLLEHLLPTATPDSQKGMFVEFFRIVVDGSSTFSPFCFRCFHTRNRVAFLFDIFPGKKILGFSSL